MTLSELRRGIDVLKRKFARELATIKLRRIAEAVANDWDPAVPPEPSDIIQRIVKVVFRLPTFARFRRCLDDALRRGEVPDPESIVLSLLPWAEHDRYRDLLRWELPVPAPRP